MFGPEIIRRSLSVLSPRGKQGELWQYHSRSDHHSKVGCWAVLADLLRTSALMRAHAATGKLVIGINHELCDFPTGRRKILDLVVARPAERVAGEPISLSGLAQQYGVLLSHLEKTEVDALPSFLSGKVGAVLVALEAKATMTEHSKARPRLYDELTSSHATVHGASSNALALALVMVNAARTFISPGRQVSRGEAMSVNQHKQPAAAVSIIDKLRELPRRASDQQAGFDGLGVILVDFPNDGTPVQLVNEPPAPQPGDLFHYATMITRAANEYDTRFRSI